jgi:hypothetical protein
MNKFSTWLLGAGLACAVSSAHAGRPLQTEDAGVLARGSCEIEHASERLSESGQRATSTALGLGCGLGRAWQVGIEAARERQDGSSTSTGTLLGKLGLLGSDEDPLALTLAWAVGSTRQDERWRTRDTSLNLVASLQAGPGAIHMNVGHTHERETRRGVANWALAYEHEGAEVAGLNWAPMAEFFGDDRGARWGNIALRITLLPEKAFIDFSAGRQAGSTRARLFTAGFKIAF